MIRTFFKPAERKAFSDLPAEAAVEWLNGSAWRTGKILGQQGRDTKRDVLGGHYYDLVDPGVGYVRGYPGALRIPATKET